jgi:hypothetical protein
MVARTGASRGPDGTERLRRFAKDREWKDLFDPGPRALLMVHAALLLVSAESSVDKRNRLAADIIASFEKEKAPSINQVLQDIASSGAKQNPTQLLQWSRDLAHGLLRIEPR